MGQVDEKNRKMRVVAVKKSETQPIGKKEKATVKNS